MNHISIGLDVRMIRHTGIGTYLRGLLEGFDSAQIAGDFRPVLFGSPEPGIVKNRNTRHSGSPEGAKNSGLKDFTAPIYSIREQLAYPKHLSRCKVWHAPHYNVPVMKGRTKLVVTIHDIIHWIFRKQFLNPAQMAYAGFMLRRAVTSSDHILAVSGNTKRDLIEHFRAPAEKITVTYEGVGRDHGRIPPEELITRFAALREKYRLPEDFFLYVGLLKPHKNVHWLAGIVRSLKASGRLRSSLVLVGRKDKKYPKGWEGLRNLATDKDVIHLPGVEFDELLVLYNRAVALVHPSLYEGFGLTVLEAMKCGTPVITTRAASLAEVAGDAAILVDPKDPREMSETLIRVESDAKTREALRAKGFERVRRFDWAETARRTAAVYEKVLRS
jgi:glycosyltransferase involved in cell wall biosynthesis